MLDSYDKLIPDYILQKDFFRFGLEETIYIPTQKAQEEWVALKIRISTNKEVFMRGMKENVHNQYYFDLYRKVLKQERVKKDPSNSQNPTKVIEKLTGLKKSKDLRNFQLVAPFNRSKNIYAFTAPWNLVFMPKIMEPFMSPDNTTPLAKGFQQAFEQHCYDRFEPFIKEYNAIMNDVAFQEAVNDYFMGLYNSKYSERETMEKFEAVVREEFSLIKRP